MSLKACATVAALMPAALLLFSANAQASMVLGYEETGPGTVTGGGFVNTPAIPGSDFYGHAFSAPTATITGSPAPGFGFYDDYLFSISGATVDSFTATLDLGKLLGISDLQVRLYSTSGNPALPVLGDPAGTVIDAWSASFSYGPGISGTVDMLNPTTLTAGTYVLEVRGNVTGSAGGGYAGVLNLAPVPLPAALPLLLSGLSLLGAAAQRRRS